MAKYKHYSANEFNTLLEYALTGDESVVDQLNDAIMQSDLEVLFIEAMNKAALATQKGNPDIVRRGGLYVAGYLT
ncbi:MAG: hypothetical protein PSV35_05890 [bacterium]|nr:hypothetical protein [bacterium]